MIKLIGAGEGNWTLDLNVGNVSLYHWATGDSLLDAYEKALSCDPTSAFGGIIALNQKIDEDTAKKIIEIFTEVIIAPEISEEAKNIFKNKNNLRVLILKNKIPFNNIFIITLKTIFYIPHIERTLDIIIIFYG